MKYFVAVDGVEHEVVVESDPSDPAAPVELTVDGKRLELAYREIDALGQVLLLCEDRSFGISIDGDENRTSVTIAGHVYHVTLEDERERAARAAERTHGRAGGLVSSVMPGVVVRILVRKGEAVEKGTPLLILEAMKMQNEIAAPGPGVVREVHVAAGEAVKAGARLVTLEA